jgi:hypothetical protein
MSVNCEKSQANTAARDAASSIEAPHSHSRLQCASTAATSGCWHRSLSARLQCRKRLVARGGGVSDGGGGGFGGGGSGGGGSSSSSNAKYLSQFFAVDKWLSSACRTLSLSPSPPPPPVFSHSAPCIVDVFTMDQGLRRLYFVAAMQCCF